MLFVFLDDITVYEVFVIVTLIASLFFTSSLDFGLKVSEITCRRNMYIFIYNTIYNIYIHKIYKYGERDQIRIGRFTAYQYVFKQDTYMSGIALFKFNLVITR